jgi:hypothetical protein
MFGRKFSSLLAAGAVSVGVACIVLLATAATALACVTDTDGDCFRPNYHVQRTDGSLAAWTGPGVGHIAYWLSGNGTPVEVVCETTSSREDGQPYAVWDQLDDGVYVYGYYLDTPGDGYHPALTPCSGGGSSPPPPTSVTGMWCPTSDATRPSCSATGAFQAPRGYDRSGHFVIGVNDYKTATPQGAQVVVSPIGILTPGGNIGGNLVGTEPDTYRWNEALAFAAGFHVAQWTDAEHFFRHYLDNTGADLRFDARVPYSESVGFATAANQTVNKWVGRADQASADRFDSGYVGFDPSGTNQWQSADWEYAIGHCFYRVVGTRRGDGSWSVHLQLTSYYQFTPRTLVKGPLQIGSDMHRLEQIGWARNFREIGNGTLVYNAAGLNPK